MKMCPFRLTARRTSQGIYLGHIRTELDSLGVEFVDDWREADVVHLFETNLLTTDVLRARTFLQLVPLFRSSTPVVASVDDLYFLDRPELTGRPQLYRLNRRLHRLLLNYCDRIITFSESAKRAIKAALPAADIAVVAHGVDNRFFVTPSDERPPSVLHVSFASRAKNTDAVVNLAASVDAPIEIVGGGWPSVVPERIKDRENVHVVGYMSPDKLVERYANAAVFYYPTRHESFGLPLLEAMAATTAVVTTDVGAVPEVVGDTALVHDPDDGERHIASVEALLHDDDRRLALASHARTRADEFTWERSASTHRAVYECLLKE